MRRVGSFQALGFHVKTMRYFKGKPKCTCVGVGIQRGTWLDIVLSGARSLRLVVLGAGAGSVSLTLRTEN